jgi:hypothetical protein
MRREGGLGLGFVQGKHGAPGVDVRERNGKGVCVGLVGGGGRASRLRPGPECEVLLARRPGCNLVLVERQGVMAEATHQPLTRLWPRRGGGEGGGASEHKDQGTASSSFERDTG